MIFQNIDGFNFEKVYTQTKDNIKEMLDGVSKLEIFIVGILAMKNKDLLKLQTENNVAKRYGLENNVKNIETQLHQLEVDIQTQFDTFHTQFKQMVANSGFSKDENEKLMELEKLYYERMISFQMTTDLKILNEEVMEAKTI